MPRHEPRIRKLRCSGRSRALHRQFAHRPYAATAPSEPRRYSLACVRRACRSRNRWWLCNFLRGVASLVTAFPRVLASKRCRTSSPSFLRSRNRSPLPATAFARRANGRPRTFSIPTRLSRRRDSLESLFTFPSGSELHCFSELSLRSCSRLSLWIELFHFPLASALAVLSSRKILNSAGLREG